MIKSILITAAAATSLSWCLSANAGASVSPEQPNLTTGHLIVSSFSRISDVIKASHAAGVAPQTIEVHHADYEVHVFYPYPSTPKEAAIVVTCLPSFLKYRNSVASIDVSLRKVDLYGERVCGAALSRPASSLWSILPVFASSPGESHDDAVARKQLQLDRVLAPMLESRE